MSSKRSKRSKKPKTRKKKKIAGAKPPRKPKFISLNSPPPDMPPPPPLEAAPEPESAINDPPVTCLLEHHGGATTSITDIFRSSTSTSSSVVYDEVLSPASPSVDWDREGLARRALRGRERWVFCRGSASTTTSTTMQMDHQAQRCGDDDAVQLRQLLHLKLDYDEIMTAWSDRGSLYIDGEAPQVVPELCSPFVDDGMAPNVFVEVGNGGGWAVPEMEGEGQEESEEGKKRNREERVMRYKAKRQNRLFAKRIRYEVRKLNAEKRPRIKGRFVKRVEDM